VQPVRCNGAAGSFVVLGLLGGSSGEARARGRGRTEHVSGMLGRVSSTGSCCGWRIWPGAVGAPDQPVAGHLLEPLLEGSGATHSSAATC